MVKPSTEEQDRLSRIEQLETILLAQDCAPELFAVAAEATSRDDFIRLISETLSISESWAHVISSMNWERLATSYNRERIAEELEELQHVRSTWDPNAVPVPYPGGAAALNGILKATSPPNRALTPRNSATTASESKAREDLTVVSLGARAQLTANGAGQAQCEAIEYALLSNDQEVTLTDDRGWGSSGPLGRVTIEDALRDTLTCLLPDDAEETGEQHEWAKFHAALNLVGVNTTAATLRNLPYAVSISTTIMLPTNYAI